MVANIVVTMPLTGVRGSPALITSTVFGIGLLPVWFIMVPIITPAVTDSLVWPDDIPVKAGIIRKIETDVILIITEGK